MSRRASTNEELCDTFRALLTTDFYVTTAQGEVLDGEQPARTKALADTKAWRGDVWKAFRQLEDALCPVRAFEREQARKAAR